MVKKFVGEYSEAEHMRHSAPDPESQLEPGWSERVLDRPARPSFP